MLNDKKRRVIAFICGVISVSLLCSCGSAKKKTESTEREPFETTKNSMFSVESETVISSDTSYDKEIFTEETAAESISTDSILSDSAISIPAISDEPVTLDAAELSTYSIGRTLLKDDVMYMNHTCSGFRFNFHGSSLKAEFVSSAEYCYDDIHRAWIAVYLGSSTEPYKRFPLDSELIEFTILESDEPIEADITIVKLTEEQFGTAGVKSLQLGANDVIQRVPDSVRYIEFFGDSITAGYGNEGELSHGFDTSEENGYLTYASIAARTLGADYSMICVSGMGLTASRTCDFVAGDIYPKTDAFISDEAYSFARQPQLIVVNLGANDSYYINKDSSYYEIYESRYYDLLKEIRSKNPDSVILCCICDYWKSRMPQIESVIEKLSAETDDSRIYSMILPYVKNNEDYGSDAHPKIKVQYEIADALTAEIEKLGIF